MLTRPAQSAILKFLVRVGQDPLLTSSLATLPLSPQPVLDAASDLHRKISPDAAQSRVHVTSESFCARKFGLIQATSNLASLLIQLLHALVFSTAHDLPDEVKNVLPAQSPVAAVRNSACIAPFALNSLRCRPYDSTHQEGNFLIDVGKEGDPKTPGFSMAQSLQVSLFLQKSTLRDCEVEIEIENKRERFIMSEKEELYPPSPPSFSSYPSSFSSVFY